MTKIEQFIHLCEERYHYNYTQLEFLLKASDDEVVKFYKEKYEYDKNDPLSVRGLIHDGLIKVIKKDFIKSLLVNAKNYKKYLAKVEMYRNEKDEAIRNKMIIDLHFNLYELNELNKKAHVITKGHKLKSLKSTLKSRKEGNVTYHFTSSDSPFMKETNEETVITNDLQQLLYNLLPLEERTFLKYLSFELMDLNQPMSVSIKLKDYLERYDTLALEYGRYFRDGAPFVSTEVTELATILMNLRLKDKPILTDDFQEIIQEFRERFHGYYELYEKMSSDLFMYEINEAERHSASKLNNVSSAVEILAASPIVALTTTQNNSSVSEAASSAPSPTSTKVKEISSPKQALFLYSSISGCSKPSDQLSSRFQGMLDALNTKPLQAIPYEKLITLISTLGGKIIRSNGSHRTIEINGIRGGVYEPHGHQAGVSICCTELFKSLLTRAGYLTNEAPKDKKESKVSHS